MEMTEEEYLRALERERKLYMWCLERWGGCTAQDAKDQASRKYPYQPPDAPFRGLIMHDSAWHHAMYRIHGNCYWIDHPELAQPPKEYNREYERLGSNEDAS